MSVSFMMVLALENPKTIIQSLNGLEITTKEVDCDTYYYEKNFNKVEFIQFLVNVNQSTSNYTSPPKLAFYHKGKPFSLIFTNSIVKNIRFFDYFVIALQFESEKNQFYLNKFKRNMLQEVLDLLQVDFAWVDSNEILNNSSSESKNNPLEASGGFTYYLSKKHISASLTKTFPQFKILDSSFGEMYSDEFVQEQYDDKRGIFKSKLFQVFKTKD